MVPSEGIKAGTPFGYGPNVPMGDKWEVVQGVFALSTLGEQIFLYCLDANGSPQPMTALSYNGPFQPSGLSHYLFNESALPKNLETLGRVILPYMHNYYYNGPPKGTTAETQQWIQDPKYWKGSDTVRFDYGNVAGTSAATSINSLNLLVLASSAVTFSLFALGW